MDIKIKICCIKSIAEAEEVIGYGADAIGLVGAMPSGPGILAGHEIEAIASSVKGRVDTFLLTSEVDSQAIIRQYNQAMTTTIQLVDHVAYEDLIEVRTALPEVELVQVIHVQDESSIDQALAVTPYVDKLLLDSGQPNAATKTLGGTGKTHNWNISKSIVDQSDIPVLLAGGLNYKNVMPAIDQVQPYGIDLCSGVRTDDMLDKEKLERFMNALGR